MNRKSGIPFTSFTREGLQNLLLISLAVFYIAQFELDILSQNMCGQLAIDYCSFWSAAKTANEQGYAGVYDLKNLEELQRKIFPSRYANDGEFATVPTPYLPVFILPFQVLSFLGPYLGYWVWSILNLAIFIYYLQFFSKHTTNERLSWRLLLMLLLSLPVFLNFYYGQVNTWLTICVGEYTRAAMTGKPFRAGLWLGGLLIKPQYLILIGIALLIQRATKILMGLGVSSLAIIGASFLMAETNGFVAIFHLWLGYTDNLPATGPDVMMNWRMISVNLSPYLGAVTGRTIALTGMAITTLGILFIWRRSVKPTSSLYVIAILGTFAATGAVAWHSHISSAMILIPLLVYLSQPQKHLSTRILSVWIFAPPLFRFVAFILAILIQTQTVSSDLISLVNLLIAIFPFGLNIYLLGWAVAYFRKTALHTDAFLVKK